ncbi:DUF2586 family protein [Dysgonomonas sp. ZJ279]|uniref:DUF2586 family protein n=1 Tax=Dysgonomonas sp. ZJ279 TaxID=2709796 RepID=UPI0013ECDC3C|nr:DUF2586 family protein [Dysgonomonas sp. ZJ279]
MGLPNVEIELVRNGLGLVAETNDNTCGIILPGIAIAGKLELNKAYSIFSTNGANALGIDSTGVNKDAFRHISEFYAGAGTGAKLWILVTATTAKLSDLVDTDLPLCPARVILNTAGGEIVALGLTSVTDGETTLDGLDSEVYSAMIKAQVLATEYQKRIMPFVSVIEGRKFTGDADSLRDLSTESNYRAAITLASTKSDGSASVGLVLGSIANQPVQRKISRVKNGALPIESGYLSDGVEVGMREDLETIHGKKFIILRKFPTKSGYFFNGDFTATAPEDDLNIIARIRVIDKATKIAYNTYIEELDDDVEVNDDGTLNHSVAAYLKDRIENQVNSSMAGEISRFTATVDTTVDILAGNPQKIYLDIVPKGYLSTIRVVLGFKNE